MEANLDSYSLTLIYEIKTEDIQFRQKYIKKDQSKFYDDAKK